MAMSEEISTPRSTVKDLGEDSDSALLRKEVVEARNLIIKNDNLLKNLHAELKAMGRRYDEQEGLHRATSVTAYILFALIAVGGAVAYARAEVHTAREEAQVNEARAKALQQDAEKIKSGDQTRRETSEKAMRVYEMLGSEKDGAALSAAMQQAVRLDRKELSALEARAIDDRAAGMKVRIAEAALSAGQSAFRRQDWKAASEELGHYVELEPKVQEPLVWFHLGNARMQTHEFQGAIIPLENFLKGAGGTKTAQYAGSLLGQAYEETGNAAKAREAYERAANLYPGSDVATGIRNRLRRMDKSAAAAATAATGAAPATGVAPAH
jgi:tetratricopeptide (TPR) repeat protein